MTVSRRALLRAATGPLLLRAGGLVTVAGAPLVAGCGSGGQAIEVFVVWSGGELAAFRQTVDEFSRQAGRQVRIVTVGQQAEELLRARLDANNPPDVAVVPLLSLIKEYARNGKLVPLDRSLSDGIPRNLRETVSVNGQLFGLWVKVAHKSLFWHRASTLSGVEPPLTWSDLVERVRRSAAAGRAPLSIGAADGWVVTDWFENVLASADDGDSYERLARGENLWESPAVSTTLTSLAQAWSVPRAFPDGPQRALLTQYEESVVDVLVKGRAELLLGADFVTAVVERFRTAGLVTEPPEVFRCPPLHGTDPPLIVSGDVATLTKDSPAGRELIRWLAHPSAFTAWIKLGGFLSPDITIPIEAYPTQLSRDLADQLRTSPNIHTDLSDQLGGRFGGGGSRGMFRILPKFFAAATAGGAAARDAVAQAQAELADAAKRTRSSEGRR